MGPRQQPAKGAAGPRPPAQAAGAGPSGQPVGHGRSPLTVDMRLRTGMVCWRVRLRTGSTPARGRGTFKCGRNERRRRRLRRAGGLHGGTVSSGRRRHRRPARIARRPGRQGAAAAPAPCSHRTPARSPGGCGRTGARLASHAGAVSRGMRRVRRAGCVALARGVQGAARGVDPANHARARGRRYSGHSIIDIWASMSKGLAPGCFSGVLGLFHVERRPRCTTGGQLDPPVGAGAGGALLRAPITARPLAAGRVRALPWHGQAGGSGRGAGGAAARRGRIWGACRRGRALQKM